MTHYTPIEHRPAMRSRRATPVSSAFPSRQQLRTPVPPQARAGTRPTATRRTHAIRASHLALGVAALLLGLLVGLVLSSSAAPVVTAETRGVPSGASRSVGAGPTTG